MFFFILGVYLLYTGPNTGIFFQINLGLLVGIGLGGTAISIPMSIVGKHFPLSNRTIAMSIVTAVGSFGIFYHHYSLHIHWQMMVGKTLYLYLQYFEQKWAGNMQMK